MRYKRFGKGANSQEKHDQQRAAAPRWFDEHLKISSFLLFIVCNLSSDLDVFSTGSLLVGVFWVVVEPLDDFPRLIVLANPAEITGGL